jgi:hypothetical protein
VHVGDARVLVRGEVEHGEIAAPAGLAILGFAPLGAGRTRREQDAPVVEPQFRPR